MKKFINLLLIFIFALIIYFKPLLVFAQNNLATCDLCGYCLNYEKIPPDWSNCCKCLYEKADCNDPKKGSTLTVSQNFIPPTPIPGRWWGLGRCISFAGGFTSEGAASSLTQVVVELVGQIAGGVAFLFFLYGSFIILTSQSQPEKINHGKKIISGALIGLIISLGSVFIINLIGNTLLRLPFFR